MNSGSAFVERTFFELGGPTASVRVALFKPVASADQRSYRCEFKISGQRDSENIEFYGVGIDSIDALFNALEMVRAHIDIINKQNFGGKLRWLDDDSPDLGLTSHWSKVK